MEPRAEIPEPIELRAEIPEPTKEFDDLPRTTYRVITGFFWETTPSSVRRGRAWINRSSDANFAEQAPNKSADEKRSCGASWLSAAHSPFLLLGERTGHSIGFGSGFTFQLWRPDLQERGSSCAF